MLQIIQLKFYEIFIFHNSEDDLLKYFRFCFSFFLFVLSDICFPIKR